MLATESPEQRILRSIGIPESEEYLSWVSGDYAGHYLDALITDDFARALWSRWNPEQPERIDRDGFREAFRQMVAEYVSFGLRVDHLQDVCKALPEPGPDRSNWVRLFEGAVAGRDKCKLRIIMSPGRYRDCVQDQPDDDGQKWSEILSMMRDGLFYELGIIYPAATLASDDTLQEHEFRVEWNDVQLAPRPGIARDQLMVNATVGRLLSIGIEGESFTNPANGNECALVGIAEKAACERAGLTTWTWLGFLILATSGTLRRAALAFVNRYLIEHYLNSLAQAWPVLVRQVREQIDRDVLVQVIRGLLAEEISIRDLKAVLESMLMAQSAGNPPASTMVTISHPASRPLYRTPPSRGQPTVADYIEHVRASMAKYISYKYSRGAAALNVYRVTLPVEQRLRQPADLTLTEVRKLLDEVRKEVANLRPDTQNPVVLSAFSSRRRLRAWIRLEFPHLAVLSHNELPSGKSVREMGTIDPELKPYDESFYRHWEAIAGWLEENQDEYLAIDGTIQPWDGPVGEVLTNNRWRIVNGVTGRFQQEREEPLPEDVVQQFAERYVDSYGDLLITGRPDRLEDTLRILAKALLVEGTRCSHMLSMALEIHRRIRHVLAEEFGALPKEDAMRQFHEVLDQFDRVAHRVVNMCLTACLARGSER